jgi:hypothetical protein
MKRTEQERNEKSAKNGYCYPVKPVFFEKKNIGVVL